MTADDAQRDEERLDELLRTLKAKHPQDTEDQLRRRFSEAVQSDPELTLSAIRLTFRDAQKARLNSLNWWLQPHWPPTTLTVQVMFSPHATGLAAFPPNLL
jgi:hypothetical protein